MRHVPPTRLYCGDSQIGLFGSFHAVHMATFGSGVLPIPSDAFCCHSGGIQSPLYRSAAAYAKSSRFLKFVGAVVRACPPLAQPGVKRIEKTTLMFRSLAYLTRRSYSAQL